MQITFKGAIFDADGTLIDSMYMWHSLGLHYLQKLGIHENESLNQKLFVMSFEQGCEYLQTHYDLKKSSDEIRGEIIEMIRDFYIHDVKLKEGVREFLDVLKNKSILMVIATSGDRELLTSALKRLKVYEYFDAIFTCTELQTDKHDSKIFMVCSDYMNLKPEDVAVFEDVFYALNTAKNAGFFTIGIADNESIGDRRRIIEVSDYFIEDFTKEAIEK